MEQKKFILLKIVFIFLALVSGLSILAAGDQVAFAELDGIDPLNGPAACRPIPAPAPPTPTAIGDLQYWLTLTATIIWISSL
jgi:hypothetical protein